MTAAFRLAGLLRFRKLQEDQASATLARANGKRRTHAVRTAQARGELAETASQAATATALSASAAARAASRSMLHEFSGLAAALDASAHTAQADLVVAKMAASSLAKLAERHEAAAGKATLAEEQRFLDELAASKRTDKP